MESLFLNELDQIIKEACDLENRLSDLKEIVDGNLKAKQIEETSLSQKLIKLKIDFLLKYHNGDSGE